MAVYVSKIEIKALTRGDVRRLRRDGIVLKAINDLSDEKQDEMLDHVLAIACPHVDPETLTPGEAISLFVRIVKASFADGNVLKKSESPLPLTSPADGGMSAENAGAQALSPSGTAPELAEING
jgi:hypothetical protein